MALETRHVVIGTLLAIAVGGGLAWRSNHDSAPSPGSPALPGTKPSSAPSATAPALYKWQDEHGIWNYSDQPPTDRPFERIDGTPNVNSVPTVVPESGMVEPSAPPNP